MQVDQAAEWSPDAQRPLRERVLQAVLIWCGLGGVLNGLVLLFQFRSREFDLLSVRIGAYALFGLPVLALLQRAIGYRKSALLLLAYLLVVCTYFQCFHGLTSATTLGHMVMLMLAGVFFYARGVLWCFTAILAGVSLSCILLMLGIVEPWPDWFWDPHDALVWMRYAFILLCFGGGVSSSLALMIRSLEETEAQLQTTLAGERKERAQRERVQKALDQSQRIEALGQFAAGMAHDFNNTLMVIMGGAHMIRSHHPRLPAEVLALSDEIAERAELGAQTVRQLLSLGRGDVGKPARVRLESVLRRSLPTLKQAMTPDIQVQLDCTTDVMVQLDVARLQQALLNLATNARDAMPTGGSWQLRVSEQELHEVPLGWNAAPGAFVCVECADTGIGLDAALLDKIFEPFYTTKDAGHGTGLGLPMVRKTVLDARGFIQVTSQPGRGTAFRLYLPALGSGVAPSPLPPSAASEQREPNDTSA